MVPQSCRPDRSAAQWRDLWFLFRFSRTSLSPLLFSYDTGSVSPALWFETTFRMN
jgi:hypothetical protein